MLKSTALPEKSTLNRLEVGDGEGSDDISGDGVEITKKSGKSKGQKAAKSQKLSKSGKSKGKKLKKPSKSGNLPNFNSKKVGPSFPTPKAKTAFNRLRLDFTKTPIF